VPNALEKNLAWLREHDRELAEQIRTATIPREVEIFPARSGVMTAVVKGISLHSRFDPITEAEKWASSASAIMDNAGSKEPVVFGLGLGYHILALAKFTNRLHVVEPRLEIFKLAFSHADFSHTFSKINFKTGLPPAEDWPPVYLLTHTPSKNLNRKIFNLWMSFINGRETIGELLANWKFIPGMSETLGSIREDKPGQLPELASIIENRKGGLSEGENLLLLLNELSRNQ